VLQKPNQKSNLNFIKNLLNYYYIGNLTKIKNFNLKILKKNLNNNDTIHKKKCFLNY